MHEERFWEPWEPWQPQVGQRVRFRFRAECICPYCGEGHGERDDGRIATVKEDSAPGSECGCCRKRIYNDGHRFVVAPDNALFPGGLLCAAAIELEPVEV